MIKKTLVLIFSLLSLTGAYSQINIDSIKINPDSKLMQIEKIVEAPGITKDVLYQRSKNWLIANQIAGKNIIIDDNKSDGILVGSGIFDFLYIRELSKEIKEKVISKCTYSIRLYLKEERYKIVLTDLKINDDMYNDEMLNNKIDYIFIAMLKKDDKQSNAIDYGHRIQYAILNSVIENLELINKSIQSALSRTAESEF